MLTHAFVSSVSDLSSAAKTRPSDWNARHIGSAFAIPCVLQFFGPVQNARAGGPSAVGTWAFVTSVQAAGAKPIEWHVFSIYAARWVQNWIPVANGNQSRLVWFTLDGNYVPRSLMPIAVFSGTATDSPVTDTLTVTSAFNSIVSSPPTATGSTNERYIGIQTLGSSWQLFESRLELDYRIEM